MITLILADDHPVFSTGLRAVFAAEPDLTVLAVVATGRRRWRRCRAPAGRRRPRHRHARRRRAVGLRRAADIAGCPRGR